MKEITNAILQIFEEEACGSRITLHKVDNRPIRGYSVVWIKIRKHEEPPPGFSSICLAKTDFVRIYSRLTRLMFKHYLNLTSAAPVFLYASQTWPGTDYYLYRVRYEY